MLFQNDVSGSDDGVFGGTCLESLGTFASIRQLLRFLLFSEPPTNRLIPSAPLVPTVHGSSEVVARGGIPRMDEPLWQTVLEEVMRSLSGVLSLKR